MPDIIKEIFIKNLRYLMEAKEVTQADICRELGVSSATVSDWCNGKKFPRTDKLQRIAELLNVRPSALTSETGLQDYEDQQRLEALHQDPRLCLLFDRTRRMSHDDVDFMLQFADRILKERDSE